MFTYENFYLNYFQTGMLYCEWILNAHELPANGNNMKLTFLRMDGFMEINEIYDARAMRKIES